MRGRLCELNAASEALAREAPLARWLRLPVLAAGGLSLLAGVVIGLARLGVVVVPVRVEALSLHGPVMLGGAFGTLVALERAAALRSSRALVAPALSAAGAIAAVLGAPRTLAALSLTLASAALAGGSMAASARVGRAQSALATLGALCWLVGNALWLSGRAPAHVVSSWIAFLVLTIARARVEFRDEPRPSSLDRATFGGGASLVALGGVAAASSDALAGLGIRLLGAGLLLVSAWLLAFDIAREPVERRGPPRFLAAAMLGGSAWLGVAGALMIRAGTLTPGLASYDAALHAVFLGFTLSFVFGHAPRILPSITGATLPWRPRFFAHLALLHVSLLVRVLGDFAGRHRLRALGATGSAIAIAVFAASTIAAVIEHRARAAATARSARESGRPHARRTGA